jgi:hypothetical protein
MLQDKIRRFLSTINDQEKQLFYQNLKVELGINKITDKDT